MFSKRERTPPRAGEDATLPGAGEGDSISVISAGVVVFGDLKTDGDLEVHGAVEGDIRGRSVTIAEGGRINGNIVAEEATIAGRFTGRVEATTISVRGTAKIVGELLHFEISVERGAEIDGLRPWRPKQHLEERRQTVDRALAAGVPVTVAGNAHAPGQGRDNS